MKNDIIELTEQNNIEGIKKFIADGGDINFQDKNGWTALMFRSWYIFSPMNFKIVKILIKAGAKLDIQDKSGDTALMIASLFNNHKIAEILIDAGADEDIKNNEGETALDYAKERNYTEIIELLTRSKAIIPTSKVIQITTTEKLNDVITTALCQDGSIWKYYNQKWSCILEAPSNEN
jgi:ankyrin repeat protein